MYMCTFHVHACLVIRLAPHDDLVQDDAEREHVARLWTALLAQIVVDVLRRYP